MTIMDYIDIYRVLINGVTAAAIAVLAVSVFRIMTDSKKRKAAGAEDGLSFLCGYGFAGRMRAVYTAGEILTLVMICVHAVKALFLGAYIPKDTIWFYGTVFLLFLILILQNSILTAFRLGKNGCYYRGKNYDREKCFYIYKDSKLSLFAVRGEAPDAIVLEYSKEAEVKIPNHKKEETEKMLEEYYTELPEGAVDAEAKKTKKFYKGDLVWGITVCVLAAFFIYRGYIINEWEMKDIADGIEITAYNGNQTWIQIPERVDEQEVVSIRDFGDSFFWKKTRVKDVFIPDTVDRISGDSFVGYESLQYLYLPSSIQILGENAFQECISLESVMIRKTDKGDEVVDLSDTNIMVKEIGLRDCDIKDGMLCRYPYLESVLITGDVQIDPGAFRGCKTLEGVLLPDGMENIADSAFAGCGALKFVTFPESLKIIGNAAFSGCGSLTQVELPDGTEVIGERAFEGCRSLQYIRLPESTKTIGGYVFSESGLIEAAIAGDLDRIPDGTFANCRSLETVILPDGIETIGESAFSGCEALRDIPLPDSVKTIGTSAFSGSGLTEIAVPENVTRIPDKAFAGCYSLRKVTLPDNVETIGDFAFSGCEILKNIELSDSLVSLGKGAFKDCSGLETVSLPVSLQVVPKECFYGCSSLAEIEIPEGYTEVDPYAFYKCSGAGSITLPDGLTTIREYAFSQMLVDSVFLPDSLTQFSGTAFISAKQDRPVCLYHTENSKITDQIEDACRHWQIYNAYKSYTVKDREEYEGRGQYADFSLEAARTDGPEEVVYVVEDTNWEDVRLDRLLEVDVWKSYDAGSEDYTYVEAAHPMTIHFEEDGTGVLTDESEESFTWKLGEVSAKNILVTMDKSGKEYALTFYSYDEDQLYLGLHMWDRKVFFFAL